MSKTILIIGAGPAGLSAAHLLCKEGQRVIVYESHPTAVGGLSQTARQGDFLFDIGGHRFYTKAKEVETFWHDILGEDFLRRTRLSRIFYNGKFFKYPLELGDVLKNISFLKGCEFLASYIKVKILKKKEIHSFEDWVISQFGVSLYEAFFKSYTEKVWGRPCHDISKDWAAQRINNLSISQILLEFIKKFFNIRSQQNIKSLIEEFDYPRKGPGMLWERVSAEIQKMGAEVHLNHHVSSMVSHEGKWQLHFSNGDSSPMADHIISTAPVKTLLKGLKPAPSQTLKSEIENYKYRDFLTVILMFKQRDSFPDNWLYIHDSRVKVARIQNYKNWSPEMVPSPEYTSYGLEYFCQKDDDFWSMTDEELVELAIREIGIIDLPFTRVEFSSKVIRMPYAYPVYDHNHSQRSELLQRELESYPGLHLAGRNGLHRYNNQDHSIKTAMIVTENILNKSKRSPWKVNQDAQYLEEESRS